MLTEPSWCNMTVKTPSACIAYHPYIHKHSMRMLCKQQTLGGAEETNIKQSEQIE